MNDIEWARFVEQQKGGVKRKTKKLTGEQQAAIASYEFCLREEDRYLSSVFANPRGQLEHEAKTRQALENAKRLGVDYLC